MIPQATVEHVLTDGFVFVKIEGVFYQKGRLIDLTVIIEIFTTRSGL